MGLPKANPREYSSYQNMIQRCTNPKNPDFKYYGGRGITICPEWRKSFRAFFADMGARPDGHSIDRIDVNGNYEPGNCRWLPLSQQNRNRRISARPRSAKPRPRAIGFRLNRDTKASLTEAAARDGLSVSAQVNVVLTDWLKRRGYIKPEGKRGG